jgi:hypothetical protein
VELDPHWEKRVVKHLSVEGPWLRYAPQLLGRSDRTTPEQHPLGAEGRLAAALQKSPILDPSTLSILTRTVKEHVAALSLVGMSESARPWLEGVDQLAPGDAFVTSARLRLAYAAHRQQSRHSIELRDLLRFGETKSP